MMPLSGHPTCFIKLIHGNLIGMIETNVHDSISTGSKKFEDESRITEHMFESKQR